MTFQGAMHEVLPRCSEPRAARILIFVKGPRGASYTVS